MAAPLLKGNLQPTDFADAECKVSPWVWVEGRPEWANSPDIKGYRIWVCRCSAYWFQRHEWARSGRNSTEMQEWIFSGYRPYGRFDPHMLPAPTEDEE